MAGAFAIPFRVGQEDACELNVDGSTGLEALLAIGALMRTYRTETWPAASLEAEPRRVRSVATDVEGIALAHNRLRSARGTLAYAAAALGELIAWVDPADIEPMVWSGIGWMLRGMGELCICGWPMPRPC